MTTKNNSDAKSEKEIVVSTIMVRPTTLDRLRNIKQANDLASLDAVIRLLLKTSKVVQQ